MSFFGGRMQSYYHFRAIVWAIISAQSVQVDDSWEPRANQNKTSTHDTSHTSVKECYWSMFDCLSFVIDIDSITKQLKHVYFIMALLVILHGTILKNVSAYLMNKYSLIYYCNYLSIKSNKNTDIIIWYQCVFSLYEKMQKILSKCMSIWKARLPHKLNDLLIPMYWSKQDWMWFS